MMSLKLYAESPLASGVRSTRLPFWPNCGASYIPIIATSNCLPPAATSRVVTSRRVPSSSTVYFTLMPVFAVNSDGVSAAMSFICGLSTMATLMVPPFEPAPAAGVPLELELLDPPPPPQPAAINAAAATATDDQRRRVPLIGLSSCVEREGHIPSPSSASIRGIVWGVKPIFGPLAHFRNLVALVCLWLYAKRG